MPNPNPFILGSVDGSGHRLPPLITTHCSAEQGGLCLTAMSNPELKV